MLRMVREGRPASPCVIWQSRKYYSCSEEQFGVMEIEKAHLATPLLGLELEKISLVLLRGLLNGVANGRNNENILTIH